MTPEGRRHESDRRGTKTNLTGLESIKVGVRARVNGSGTAVGNVPSLVDVRHCEGVVIDVLMVRLQMRVVLGDRVSVAAAKR